MIVYLLKVQLGEHGSTRYPGGEISNVWKRIPVRNRHIVQPPVITTRPPSSLLLTNCMERKKPGRRRTLDDSSFLHGRELGLGGSQLLRIQASRFSKYQRTRLSQQMMSNLMARFGGHETI